MSAPRDEGPTLRQEMQRAWRYWDFRFLSVRSRWGICVGIVFLFLFLVVGFPLIFAPFKEVPYDKYGVIKLYNGKLDPEVKDPGMHNVGYGATVIPFSRWDLDFEFTSSGESSSPISVRVLDGQIVDLDVSFQIELKRDELVKVYSLHRENYPTTFSNIARSVLRDVAAQHPSDEFFVNRTQIEEEMRAGVKVEAAARQATLTGFQVRKIGLPEALDSRIIDIQLRSQKAREGVAKLQLDQVEADTARILLELSTNRTQRNEKFEQETSVLVLDITRLKEEIEKNTEKIVAQIKEGGNKNRTLYQKQTELILEEIDLQIVQVEEATRRLSDEISVGLQTNLTIYNQQTNNIKLEYDKEIALVREETKQNVTRINAETEEFVIQFRNQLDRLTSQAILEAELQLIAANLEAAQAEAAAFADSHSGLPDEVFLTMYQSDAQLRTVKLADVFTPEAFTEL